MTVETKSRKGIFISLCGTEGSGKGTLINGLKKWAEGREDVIFTREPGGCKASEAIRNVVVAESVDIKTELLLMMAARREHLIQTINPALSEGKIVICDRFMDSSIAYQGYGRGLSLEEIDWIHQFIDVRVPDLTLWLDLTPEEGLARIAGNQRETNRLDQEGLAFHHRVYEGYQALAAENPERIKRIDGRQTPEQRFDEALTHILSL